MKTTYNKTAPFVCFKCRKQFDRVLENDERFMGCPECGNRTYRYDYKFKVPKKSDDSEWLKVEYLKDHGFFFQNVYDLIDKAVYRRARYPINIKEAKEFVQRYKGFSINMNQDD